VALAHQHEPVFRELGPADEILRSIGSYLEGSAGESEGGRSVAERQSQGGVS
jgi:hypothetical protein